MRTEIRRQADKLEWDISGHELIGAAGDEAMAAAAIRVVASRSDRCGDEGAYPHRRPDGGTAAAAGGAAHRPAHDPYFSHERGRRAAALDDHRRGTQYRCRTSRPSRRPYFNALDLARALEIDDPKLAILSATEMATDRIPSSVEAARLTRWAGEHIADAQVYGPLAFDNAVSGEAARLKGISSPVGGSADILVGPQYRKRQRAVQDDGLFHGRLRRRPCCGRAYPDHADQPCRCARRPACLGCIGGHIR